MNWKKVKEAARRKAAENGHQMPNFTKLSHCLWVAHCKKGCGAHLMVGGKPDITGEAIAEKCLEIGRD